MKALPVERMGENVQGIRLLGDPKRRPEPEAVRILARLDVRGKHSIDCDTGDFSDPNLEHLAVRVGLLD